MISVSRKRMSSRKRIRSRVLEKKILMIFEVKEGWVNLRLGQVRAMGKRLTCGCSEDKEG